MNLEKRLKDALNPEHVSVHASEETNERIQKIIKEHSAGQQKRVTKKQWKLAVSAICAVLLVGVWQIPAVKVFSAKVLRYFTTNITFRDGDKNESLSWQDAYVSIPEKAPKKEKVFTTMQEAGKQTGMDFLKSKDEYHGKKAVKYYPYLSGNGTMNGFMVIDSYYATGDLTDILVDWQIEDDGTFTAGQSSYRAGKKFKSPIEMQVLVRSDKDEGVNLKDHELEYSGTNLDYTDAGESSDAEIYLLENLGVKAVLETVYTDGPAFWNKEKESAVSHAFFIYQGMEYQFMGDVSRDTMKEFLNTLE